MPRPCLRLSWLFLFAFLHACPASAAAPVQIGITSTPCTYKQVPKVNAYGQWTCGGGSTSTGTNTLQVSDGTGGFNSYAGTSCSAGSYFSSLNAAGTASCSAQPIPLTTAAGGTGQTSAADDNVLLGNGTAWQSVSLPNCPGGLAYATATNTFSCASGGGTVTAVTASAPLSSSGGSAPNITMTEAGGSSDGWLSTYDYNIFSGKADAKTCSAHSYLTAVGVGGGTCSTLSFLDIGGSASDAQLTGAYSGVGACGSHQWASTLTRSSAPTCTQPGFSDLSSTASDAQLANAYSGVGACGSHQWTSTLTRNTAPTCTQPAFSDVSGTVATGQLPALTATTLGAVKGTAVSALTCGANAANYGYDSAGTMQCRSYVPGVQLPVAGDGFSGGNLGLDASRCSLYPGAWMYVTGTGWVCDRPVVMGRDSGCSAGAVPRANNDGTNTWACGDAPRITGDIGGTYGAPTIVSTHLSSVLPESQGGTGAGATTCTAGQALTSNGTAHSCTSTLTANAYSGTLPIANGGTNTTNTPINGGSAYGTGSAINYTAAGTANQKLFSNGAAAPTWGDAPSIVKMTSTVSTSSSTTPTTVLTFPAPANAYVYFYCQLITAGTTTASAKFNWNYPTNGGTFLTTWTKWLTSTTLPVWETISMVTPANWTTGCTAGCLVPAWLVWTVSGGYSNGTSSGSLTLQLESATAGQTVQVYAGSGCVYY